MAQNYNIDSDSDEEEVEAVATISGSSTWHLHDIEKVFHYSKVICGTCHSNSSLCLSAHLQLKEQTSGLLDATWKDTRNKHLLNKMLELEQPTITVKVCIFHSLVLMLNAASHQIRCPLHADGGLPAPRRRVRVAHELHNPQRTRLCSSRAH